MTYRGQIRNGVVVLDGDPKLPEGAQVHVELVTEADLKSLHEGLLKFAGICKDLPSDMARNHDHYAHGAPKRLADE